MKLAVIVDNMKVSRWQAEALRALKECPDLVFYNCVNTPPSSKKARHGLYYVLNLFTVRNRFTRSGPVPAIAGSHPVTVDFHADQDGLWQRFPDSLLDRIERDQPAAILKFGMSLLRVPDATRLACPILSFHHGDPDHFRGRPAGFYEVLQDRPMMGQIVQILSNRLDGGQVVAFAETKVHRHSYRATLEEAYRHSPQLINTAIANAFDGRTLGKLSTGHVYRLPTNTTVLGFCSRLLGRLIGRLWYGAFMEKRWQVSLASTPKPEARSAPWRLPAPDAWRTLAVPPGYSFIADPFFAPAGEGVIVEALSSSTGKGELVHIDAGSATRLSKPGLHHSYPGTITEAGSHFVVPETAQWSPPRIFRWNDRTLQQEGELDLPSTVRLLDPTLYRHGDRIFLFGNVASEGQYVLRLWHASSLTARFEEHGSSPIRISPQGGRMGGALFQVGARLFRLGQNFTGSYGDGLLVYEVEALNAEQYRETLVDTVAFEAVRGPHTLNLRGGETLFDWYTDKFSPFAGIRRLKGRYG